MYNTWRSAAYTYAHVYMYVHTHTHTLHVRICTYACIHIALHSYRHLCACIYVFYIYVSLSLSLFLSICMYIYIYRDLNFTHTQVYVRVAKPACTGILHAISDFALEKGLAPMKPLAKLQHTSVCHLYISVVPTKSPFDTVSTDCRPNRSNAPRTLSV